MCYIFSVVEGKNTPVFLSKDARVSVERRPCFCRKTLVFLSKDARVSVERRSSF